MLNTIPFLFSGIVFGLSAGIVPGPLLTLVISETLKHSKKEGIKIAIAPLITDLPVIFLTVLILAKLSDFHLILGIISILGALFLGFLGYDSITAKGIEQNLDNIKTQSIQKGIVVNLLNPHLYLFWFSIGAPTILKAFNVNLLSVVLFLVGFYSCLVGSKIVIAIICEKTKSFFSNNVYIYTMRILGFLLFIFAILFIRDGLKLLGIL